jgi:hypothetical protein
MNEDEQVSKSLQSLIDESKEIENKLKENSENPSEVLESFINFVSKLTQITQK